MPADHIRTLIAAHRGGAQLWPENSLTAFRGALSLDVDQIETDVHLSADAIPFILHDATLDRTTEATGVASQLTWKQLSGIRLKGAAGDTISHFDEVLELIAPTKMALRLELKCTATGGLHAGLVETVQAHLDRAGILARTTFTSFDRRYLAELATVEGAAGRLWLLKRPLLDDPGFPQLIAAAKAEGIGELSMHSSQMTRDRANQAAGAGLRLGFYAVNEPGDIEQAFALGASAFTTDRPDLAVQIRNANGKS